MRAHKYFWPLFLLLQFVVLQLLGLFSPGVENYYSRGLYPLISSATRYVLNFIPFSVGDCLYICLILFGCYKAWMLRQRPVPLAQVALKLTRILALGFLAFNILWGINYVRVPLKKKMNAEHPYTRQELEAFTIRLIQRTNILHLSITGNRNEKVVMPFSKTDSHAKVLEGYERLAADYPEYAHDGRSVKSSLLSVPLSYMGFAGYLNPFTGEAQINRLLPDYSYPATAAHEMAHQIGIASESEANFVGYLAAVSAENRFIQYSGYCMALRYCINALEIENEDEIDRWKEKINPGILVNFEESKAFWSRYDTFLERGFHWIYDRFLKINQQEDGIDGYSRFVDLLVHYHINHPFKE